MIKEVFLGRFPSHFRINPLVRAFIVSETFVWSSWNSVTPIFAIFAANNIAGGNTQIAASVFSVHLMVRVIFELLSGRLLQEGSETKKFLATIGGILLLSVAYLGFVFAKTVSPLFIFAGVSGLGLGIASPAKSSLFSTHLDKNKEATEWSLYDGVVLLGMAISAAVGGLIANQFGFPLLFTLAAILNLIGIVPYILYLRRRHP